MVEFQNNPDDLEGIAIIGMAGRFPGADSIEMLWENLCNGVESITFFKNEELDSSVPLSMREDKNYIKAKGVIGNIQSFDADFFHCLPREAQIMDPQTRVFLEIAWESLERAGYVPGVHEQKIGVFAGKGFNTYYVNHIFGRNDIDETFGAFEAQLLNEKDFFSTQVSYKLDLTGPSINVNTGCSTSLVAVCLAYDSLIGYQCDIALAGGVSIFSPQNTGYLYQEGKIASSDGHCRPFDKNANGTVFGSGAGVVVLKRLSEAMEDGDFIYAVIRGCGVNNDGSNKMSFTAPSVEGQAEAVLMAQANAGIAAESISYIETHGTATPLGDPVEIEALTQAFRKQTDKKQFCAIGSVKGNIGHLDSAAGVAGLIKTALALCHKKLPPSINYMEPNPKIDFQNSPFFVNTKLSEWTSDGSTRRAGVSSLGIGGTNAHIILEEAPCAEPSGPSRAFQILPFSARTEEALNASISNMAGYLEQNKALNLADVAFSLQVGRKAFAHRAMVVCDPMHDGIAALRDGVPKRILPAICKAVNRKVAFMFTGQGAQYANMGLDLYKEEPLFREEIDNCSKILQREMSVDLRRLLYPPEDQMDGANEKLKQTSIAQPALFSIEWAVAKLWMSWGVHPQSLVGHSIGEYTAACLAGVFSLDDALKIVAARGRLMQDMPYGAMLAVFLPEDQLKPLLNDDVSLAAVNHPSICVVSGANDRMDDLEKLLSERQITSRRLHTSHAFHSRMMEPMLAPFAKQVRDVRLSPPRIPFLSNVTGTWITERQATDPDYWASHLRQTVRFADCMQNALQETDCVLLEVGPESTLKMLAEQHPAKNKSHVILSSIRNMKEPPSDTAFILDTIGKLWQAGIPVDWPAFHRGAKRKRISLPTYPFERKKCWIEPQILKSAPKVGMSDEKQYAPEMFPYDGHVREETKTERPEGKSVAVQAKDQYASRSEVERILMDLWRELLGHEQISPEDDFFQLGGHSLIALRLFSRIDNIFHKRLPLATLLSAPTVRQMTDLLFQEAYTPSWSPLVKITDEGTKSPFFCIHSEGGNVLEYYKLAGYLNHDRPFYGLQAYGLEGNKIVSMSIEEMASRYIAEIKNVQPHGPYFIGGYCLGGMIAFEMARQMEATGEQISFLGMISTYSPEYLNRERPNINAFKRLLYTSLDRVELEIDNLSALNTAGKLSHIGDRMRQLGLIGRVIYEDMADLLSKILSRKPYRHSRRYNLEQTRSEQSVAFYRYQPSRIKAEMTLFRVSKQSRLFIPDPSLGWSELSSGGVESIEIKAFHKNILKEPHVKVLAQIMQKRLDETKQEVDKK